MHSSMGEGSPSCHRRCDGGLSEIGWGCLRFCAGQGSDEVSGFCTPPPPKFCGQDKQTAPAYAL